MSAIFALVNLDKKSYCYKPDDNNIPTVNSVYITKLMTLLQNEWNGNRIVCACSTVYKNINKSAYDSVYDEAIEEYKEIANVQPVANLCRYAINDYKKEYIDLSEYTNDEVHPLPMLLSDNTASTKCNLSYMGVNMRLIGQWCGDNITVSNETPKDYTKITPRFIHTENADVRETIYEGLYNDPSFEITKPEVVATLTDELTQLQIESNKLLLRMNKIQNEIARFL